MEPLLKQLRELPARFTALPANVKRMAYVGVGVLALGAILAAVLVGGAEGYQYVFTNLTTEDSTEAAGTLKAAKIPFRVEAQGAALAVPASKVYEARLLLATAGLPRGGGVGFELFDRGDLGVSEFTQKVNLRRAIEGELARTVGRLAEVRSARVHLTLPEKGLFRDDERRGAAAVVLNLYPGRTVGDRELAGIRHLVASAVPGLAPTAVTIVDGKGSVLATESSFGEQAQGFEQKLERDLESRVVSLLEPVVGAGAIIARVNAAMDASEVDTQQEVFDSENPVLRNERKVLQNQSQDSSSTRGVAGAAGNVPPQQAAQPTSGSRGNSSLEDETRNYEIGKTVTKTTSRSPRLKRLSVAILLDGVDAKARSAEDVTRLGELAKKAVGFDETRGDQFEISSVAFSRSTDKAAAAEAAAAFAFKPWHYAAAAGAALLLLGVPTLLVLRRRKKGKEPEVQLAEILRPGAKVGDILAGTVPELKQSPAQPQLPLPPPDPALSLQERARQLAQKDPVRAAHLLKAWMAADIEAQQGEMKA